MQHRNRVMPLVAAAAVGAVYSVLCVCFIPAPESEAASRTRHQLKTLASAIEVRWYYEGRLIVNVSELAHELECVGKGSVALFRYDAWRSEIRIQRDGDKVKLCSAGPDTSFGTRDDITEILVLPPRNGSATTQASP